MKTLNIPIFLITIFISFGAKSQNIKEINITKSLKDNYMLKQTGNENNLCLLDSVLVLSERSVLYRKSIYSYDGNNCLMECISYGLEDDIWLKDSKEEYYYDDNGNMIWHTFYEVNSNNQEWFGVAKGEYTYNIKGEKDTAISYDGYSETKKEWNKDNKYVYTYDENGQLSSVINYDWENDTAAWIISRKELYEYDENGCLHIIYYWDSEMKVWMENWKTLTTYDDNNQVILFIKYNKDNEVNEWIEYSKYENTYQTDKLILSIDYDWDDEADDWISRNKKEFSYNEDGTLNFKLIYRWHNNDFVWDLISKNIYYYHYHSVSIAENQKINNKMINIFPIPTYNLLFFNGLSGNETISIYKTSGELILQNPLNKNSIDITNFPEGTYIVRIWDDRELKCIQKVIVLK